MTSKTKDILTLIALFLIALALWAWNGFNYLEAIRLRSLPPAGQKIGTEATETAYRTIIATITAYSASPDETDSTPDITASGKEAVGNIAANNCLEFGTIIEYGGEIYIIEDRMNKRYGCEHIDLLMADKETALNFGRQIQEVKVLSN
jgi:3D (Asp-Asp-Asp) domain-containing protein